MKYLIAFILAIIFSGMLFISCKDTVFEIKNEVTIDSSMDTNQGIPIFSSQNSFDDAIISLNNGIIPSTINSHDFMSLNHSSVLKSSSDSIDYEDELIISDVLSEVLNTDREIIISDIYHIITEMGTFFTQVDNIELLNSLLDEELNIEEFSEINTALIYGEEPGYYKSDHYPEIYFYDSFNRREPSVLENTPDIDIEPMGLKSLPSTIEWKNVDDGKKWAGKNLDKLRGFTKSIRHYFDRRNRVDVKFYAQRFPFYSEIGIKTKTQYKGWTGIWRKKDCDEIINGWEVLNLEEGWSSDFYGPDFNPNSNYLREFKVGQYNSKYLGNTKNRLKNKTYLTVDLSLGTVNVTKKDIIGALWNVAKSEIPNLIYEKEEDVAFRTVGERRKTEVTIPSLVERRAKTNKYTYIIAQSSGGTNGVTIKGGSLGWNWGAYKNLSAEYKFLCNSILYGAARKGSKWRGVKMTIK